MTDTSLQWLLGGFCKCSRASARAVEEYMWTVPHPTVVLALCCPFLPFFCHWRLYLLEECRQRVTALLSWCQLHALAENRRYQLHCCWNLIAVTVVYPILRFWRRFQKKGSSAWSACELFYVTWNVSAILRLFAWVNASHEFWSSRDVSGNGIHQVRAADLFGFSNLKDMYVYLWGRAKCLMKFEYLSLVDHWLPTDWMAWSKISSWMWQAWRDCSYTDSKMGLTSR